MEHRGHPPKHKPAVLKKWHKPSDPSEMRRRAEARLREQQKGGASGNPKSEADIQRLLHDLEVHQIELEMQNEELSAARNEMEAMLEKYTDLYDFAPVGYFTLDTTGDIIESNLAAASLLGLARSALMHRRFGLFVSATDLPAFGGF